MPMSVRRVLPDASVAFELEDASGLRLRLRRRQPALGLYSLLSHIVRAGRSKESSGTKTASTSREANVADAAL